MTPSALHLARQCRLREGQHTVPRLSKEDLEPMIRWDSPTLTEHVLELLKAKQRGDLGRYRLLKGAAVRRLTRQAKEARAA